MSVLWLTNVSPARTETRAVALVDLVGGFGGSGWHLWLIGSLPRPLVMVGTACEGQ